MTIFPLSQKGFSLVETLVVISVTALISVTLGSLLVYFYRTNAYTLEQSTAVAYARKGVEDAMNHLREASYGSDGSYPIENAATSSISFYANVDDTVAIERVTYSLIRGVFYRAIETATGNPPSYPGTIIATSTLSSSAVNTPTDPVFRYYDNTGAEIAQPVDVSKVASVKTTLIIDVNTARAPVSFTLSGGATLRTIGGQL